MRDLYIFTFIISCVLIIFQLNKNSKINHLKGFITPVSDFKEVNTQEVSNIMQKNDKILYYLNLIDKNVTIKVLCATLLFFAVYILNIYLNLSKNTLIVVGIILFIASIILPAKILEFIIQTRINKISSDIPIFVDLLAICVQSGMTIEASIKFLENSVKQINPIFSPFLNDLIVKMEVSGLDIALEDLSKELPSREISMMCSTLRQSLKYGSKIYESLMNLSSEIRETELLQTEEAIGKLSAKMSVPLILFFMFPVIIVIAAPGVMRVLGEF